MGWDKITHHCDKNGDDAITWKEASGCGAPKKWKPAFDKVAGKDGRVDEGEFMDACHAHGKKGLAELDEEEEGDHCDAIWDKITEHCDKDHSDTITWKEAAACGAPKKWKGHFLKVAGKDGQVDEGEFLDACHAHGKKGLAEEEEEEEGGHCKRMARAIWKHCDKDGDKHISWKEARGCGAPKEWKPKFEAVAGKDGLVSHKEFMGACRKHGLAEEEVEGGHCAKIWGAITHHCDKDHDDHITWKEARGCGAPKKFKPAFEHVAGKDGKVDEGEFMAACKKHM